MFQNIYIEHYIHLLSLITFIKIFSYSENVSSDFKVHFWGKAPRIT